jgi:hypothetical protein
MTKNHFLFRYSATQQMENQKKGNVSTLLFIAKKKCEKTNKHLSSIIRILLSRREVFLWKTEATITIVFKSFLEREIVSYSN